MILVTGAGGLLGSHFCSRYPKYALGLTRNDLNVADEDAVLSALSQYKPDVVINCAGITRTNNEDPYEVYLANTFAPRNLAYWCDELGIRFIQISTNCVFAGREKGSYTEYEEPDSKDLYGRTKAEGEVYDWEYKNSLTIRTSFVGWPDPSGRGLISWLWKQSKTKPIYGYTNSWWNGLTVTALSDYLIRLAYGTNTGVIHLTGQTINKYELLATVKKVFDWDFALVPDDKPFENKTLQCFKAIPYVPGTDNFEESCKIMRDTAMRSRDISHTELAR